MSSTSTLEEALRAMVLAEARRYEAGGIGSKDFLRAAEVGLREAYARFDPSGRVAFVTFATWCVRQASTCGFAEPSPRELAPDERDALARVIEALRRRED